MDYLDKSGTPISAVQYLWLQMGGDPQRGPDSLRAPNQPTDGSVASGLQADVALLMQSLAEAEEQGHVLSSDSPSQRYASVGDDKVSQYRISTVWIGVSTSSGPKPNHFETMVFADDGDDNGLGLNRRYSSEAEAVAGHDQIVAAVRAHCAATSG